MLIVTRMGFVINLSKDIAELAMNMAVRMAAIAKKQFQRLCLAADGVGNRVEREAGLVFLGGIRPREVVRQISAALILPAERTRRAHLSGFSVAQIRPP
jgi:hypothetical protein